jgi:hypothetical protein
MDNNITVITDYITVDPQTSNGLCPNNLKLEQKFQGKSSFETGTKTRKSNKESRGSHALQRSGTTIPPLRTRVSTCLIKLLCRISEKSIKNRQNKLH